jgi:hypothetical protein
LSSRRPSHSRPEVHELLPWGLSQAASPASRGKLLVPDCLVVPVKHNVQLLCSWTLTIVLYVFETYNFPEI